jgi:hypothetical protein
MGQTSSPTALVSYQKTPLGKNPKDFIQQSLFCTYFYSSLPLYVHFFAISFLLLAVILVPNIFHKKFNLCVLMLCLFFYSNVFFLLHVFKNF